MISKKRLAIISLLILVAAFFTPLAIKKASNLLKPPEKPPTETVTPEKQPEVPLSEEAKKCVGCHEQEKSSLQSKHNFSGNQSHGQQRGLLTTTPAQNLCYQCHDPVRQKFQLASRHPVGTTLTCASCHENHAAQLTRLLKNNVRGLCSSCHSDTVSEYDKAKHSLIDNPAGKGACTICHKPHGTDFTPLLPTKVNDQCRSCHTSLPFMHPFVGSRNCTQCHNPHKPLPAGGGVDLV